MLCHLPILVFLPVEDLEGFAGACLLLEEGWHCGDRLWSAVRNGTHSPMCNRSICPGLTGTEEMLIFQQIQTLPANPALLPQWTQLRTPPLAETPAALGAGWPPRAHLGHAR